MRFFKVVRILILCAFCTRAAVCQIRPVAKKIQAEAGIEKSIKVWWEFPRKTVPKITGAKLYRSHKPISSYEDIALLSAVANVSGENYTDTVSKAGDYFYAIIALTESGEYKTIIPGMNATTVGVRAKVSEKAIQKKFSEETKSFFNQDEDEIFLQENSDEEKNDKRKSLSIVSESKGTQIRNMPLPLPTEILGTNRASRKYSEQAKKSVRGLGADSAENETKKTRSFGSPYFFEDDMFAPDGGDEYILFETLRAGLVQRKFQKSVSLLKDFLSVNRSAAATKRAEFYLGESLYFCGEYQQAVRYFLSAQSEFPELSKKWIDSCLDLLEVEF